jgi:acyl carrier protein
MGYTHDEVMGHTLALLAELAADWEHSTPIGPETLLFSELGFQSLDAVVLGNTLQERYGQPIPFADLLSEIGQRPFTDIRVREWVAFTVRQLQASVPEGTPR